VAKNSFSGQCTPRTGGFSNPVFHQHFVSHESIRYCFLQLIAHDFLLDLNLTDHDIRAFSMPLSISNELSNWALLLLSHEGNLLDIVPGLN
jgi:hypothetical protein